jgi:hypothetical protein
VIEYVGLDKNIRKYIKEHPWIDDGCLGHEM